MKQSHVLGSCFTSVNSSLEVTDGQTRQGNVIVGDPSIEVRVLLIGGSEIRGRLENAELVTRDI